MNGLIGMDESTLTDIMLLMLTYSFLVVVVVFRWLSRKGGD